jgi:hypothetical protein
MTVQYGVFIGAATKVTTGGVSYVALYGPIYGGFIANPSSPSDQGLAETEPLYVSFLGPAILGGSGTTVTLGPGESISVPTNLTTNVYVTAASSGHKFSAVAIQPVQPTPTPIPGLFPPSGPTSLTTVLPSYLYEEYDDDQNLQAFVTATNSLQQSYIDWFSQTGLPVYTGLSGPLLDWVGTNLYGIPRPTLSAGRSPITGPFNTYVLNKVVFNPYKAGVAPPIFVTDDDTYKRIITWAFYKGDGKFFNIRWLKRRLKRFMTGINGTAGAVDETYDISVTFGSGNQVNVTLATYSPLLQEALNSGALELPYQFDFVITTP